MVKDVACFTSLHGCNKAPANVSLTKKKQERLRALM